MPRRSSLVALATVFAIVLGIVFQPIAGHVVADRSDVPGATRIPQIPTRVATVRFSLPPVATLRASQSASAGASASPQPSYDASPSPDPSASAPPVIARPDVYDEVVFDVPDPLGNVLDNDDTTKCRTFSTVSVITTEPPGYPITVDTGGNVRLNATQPGSWSIPYTLRCNGESTSDVQSTVTVNLRTVAPTPTATVRPTRTPTPRPISTIRIPTRTPVSATPVPTRIIRFTPTPATSPRPSIRPIRTATSTRPPRPTATRRL